MTMTLRFLTLMLCFLPLPLLAKDVSYADGHMWMVDWEKDHASTLYTYSPTASYSIGAGAMRWDQSNQDLDVTFVRLNDLVWRKNGKNFQANWTVWGGVGSGSGQDYLNAGSQIDYETLQFYSSLRADWFFSSIDRGKTTAQIGFSPSAHSVDRWALWWVIRHEQRKNFGDQKRNTALVFRAFRKNTWLEVGLDEQKDPSVMIMRSW